MQNNREIITLQLGDYANHVATHYWNLEWENANLDSAAVTGDTSTSHGAVPVDNYSTNPYKSSKYLRLKTRSNTSSTQSGRASPKRSSHRNLNPHICFHSSRPPQASNDSIKNKLEMQQRTVYTPRTIIFALQGSEGNINSNVYHANAAFAQQPTQQQPQQVSTWDNNHVSVIAQSPHTQNKAQSNAGNAQFWSDYLLPTLHEKSLFTLDGIHHFSTPFYSYATGHDVLNAGTASSRDVCDCIDDRVRWFVESCDWLQGFQIFASLYDAFSGMLPRMVRDIHDDYSNKCVLLFDCQPSADTKHASNACVMDYTSNEAATQCMNERFKFNAMVSMAQMWDELSNVIPISVDHWKRTHTQTQKQSQPQSNQKFFNSAIIGTCLHHFTNATRAQHSTLRLMDIVDSTVKSSAMKMSMLSSCSSHLDLDMNFQAIDCIERLLMPSSPSSLSTTSLSRPIFPRLACLGPIAPSVFAQPEHWRKSDIFGEYVCLNGSALYDTSPHVVQQWKQNKMVLAQKQGSSTHDIDMYSDAWTYEVEQEQYHMKLMSKLTRDTHSPIKWNVISSAWQLPTTHPFYCDDHEQSKRTAMNHAHDEKQHEQDAAYDMQEDEAEESVNQTDRNKFSMWSSAWSASIIGQTYLNECGQNLARLIHHGGTEKIFGDVEMDLMQCKEDMFAYADAYAPIQ